MMIERLTEDLNRLGATFMSFDTNDSSKMAQGKIDYYEPDEHGLFYNNLLMPFFNSNFDLKVLKYVDQPTDPLDISNPHQFKPHWFFQASYIDE
ncbi:hypothetical protein [Spirosoma agri]|uniref:Uncharacterized protein n=1 Tax=Spirosoma agri TaxID=1987381 RepID=A0A6M0II70_9BACT|nr:hypothetical protein [Spirosoma agri]NEU67960.1 hypothetical protein [Spirosoma agri]